MAGAKARLGWAIRDARFPIPNARSEFGIGDSDKERGVVRQGEILPGLGETIFGPEIVRRNKKKTNNPPSDASLVLSRIKPHPFKGLLRRALC